MQIGNKKFCEGIERERLKIVELKMGRLSIETRQRVVLLRSLGYIVKKIQERFLEEGIAVSKFAFYKLLKKHQSTGTVADLPRRSITPKIKRALGLHQ